MLKYKLLPAIALLFFLTGMQAQTLSEHGYRYVHHLKKNGKKALHGEAILANVDVYVGNTLLSSSKQNPAGSYRFDIPAEGEAVDHYPPIYDAAMMMGIGDSLTIFQDVDDNMRRYLPPTEKEAKEIRFEIVILDIVSLEQKARAAKVLDAAVQQINQKVQVKAKAFNAGLLDAELIVKPSGLKILVEMPGQGAAIREGEPLQVHYMGCLKDGAAFDNSFSRREPIQFPAGVGQMIAGFDEGVMNLHHGAHAYLFIPPSLGYGDQGTGDGLIPGNADLIFYIEIL